MAFKSSGGQYLWFPNLEKLNKTTTNQKLILSGRNRPKLQKRCGLLYRPAQPMHRSDSIHGKEMNCRPEGRLDVDPLLRTDPHTGHIWCSTYPVHCTEPRSVAMVRTIGELMKPDGTARRRYTSGRESTMGPVSMVKQRPGNERTSTPHSLLPSRSAHQTPSGSAQQNDWMNSVARRGHQSREAVASTVRPILTALATCPFKRLTVLCMRPLLCCAQLYRVGEGRHESVKYRETINPVLRSPKEYHPTATVQMAPGVRAGASGGFGGTH